MAPLALPRRHPGGWRGRVGGWRGTLAGFALGALVASVFFVVVSPRLTGSNSSLHVLVPVGGGIVLLLMFLRRRPVTTGQPTRAAVGVRSRLDPPSSPAARGDDPSDGSGLDRGVRDIRQTDPGFDPTRFAGYTSMVFRDAQSAWTSRDIGALRDRVTPQMYAELRTRCDRLRSSQRSNRVEEIEIRAEITEAWQESGQDYVTAYIGGSIVDYTVDDLSDSLVEGSRTIPRDVEEFWTFTRPAGLNFWMLSAIQAG